jgi:sterol desaturase/sphingolipid hydroxylase (fatty acid hydroxylase superfamily)
MSLSGLSLITEFFSTACTYAGAKLAALFLSLGTFSLASWLTALCVAVLFLGLRRPRSRRQIRLKVLIRALFPRKLLHSPSSAADVWFFLFNFFLAGVLFGWAIVSYHLVSSAVGETLVARLGAMPPASLPKMYAIAILTLALFVAYELGYWIDHYLAHNIPFLWEFHKVHHQAEVLTPLTNFRVHPVDSIVFYNIQAVVMGTIGGLLNYTLGEPVQPFAIAGSNILVLVFTYLVGHLQHSHFWIVFPGVWGRLFLSPAHHQIHHSTNPAHFNKNLGACLGVWDWVFGTLHVPSKKREKLTFGVDPKVGNVHGIHEGIVAPVLRAFSLVNPVQLLRGSSHTSGLNGAGDGLPTLPTQLER